MVATILDVAAKAGVSIGTVSRVVNGSPNVSDETRSRVQRVIDELGYRPSRSARALVSGRTSAVYVFTIFLDRFAVFERLRGILDIFGDSELDLVVTRVNSHDEVLDILDTGDRPSGAILITIALDPEALDELREREVPVVAIDYPLIGTPSVFVDDFEGGRLATNHLIELGHRRIAFVGDEETGDYRSRSSSDRRAGYGAALATAALPVRPEYVKLTRHSRADAAWAATELLELAEEPTAIFANTDNQALGIKDALESQGIEVPNDVSIIGFDDIDASKYAGLTSIRQPLHESGIVAANMLLDWIRRGQRPVLEKELSLELIRRASTQELSG